jgi:phage terminase large subunit-like protein
MELKYNKSNFNLKTFREQIGSLDELIAGFKHENGVLTIYLKDFLNSEQKTTLQNHVLNHADEKHIIPDPVSPRQIRTALVLSGISIQTIEQALDSLNEPEKSIAKIAWEFSNEFNRDNPLIDSLAPVLGLTSAQLDALWNLAKTL